MLLLIADYRFRQMDALRSVLSTAVAPIQIIVDVPSQLWRWADRMSSDYEQLHDANKELTAQALILQREIQKMAALTAENIRLRELLNSTANLDETVMVAEVIGVDPDPFSHELVISKGFSDGVKVGQSLLDSAGVMGQVIAVNRYTSRVLLISDARHEIPVQVNRNGVRAIAAGKGSFEELELLHLPDTADIKEGDILVTSGLGERFPFGYPVAVVKTVSHDPGEPFAQVLITPSAQLTRSRQVVLVSTPPRQDSHIAELQGEQ